MHSDKHMRHGQNKQGYFVGMFQGRSDIASERPLTGILIWCISVLPDSRMESTTSAAQYSLPREYLSSRYLH